MLHAVLMKITQVDALRLYPMFFLSLPHMLYALYRLSYLNDDCFLVQSASSEAYLILDKVRKLGTESVQDTQQGQRFFQRP